MARWRSRERSDAETDGERLTTDAEWSQ